MNTLIKSSAIPSFRALMEDFWNNDNPFNGNLFRKEFLPAVNIKEKDGHYEIEVAAPGYHKNDFKIDIQNKVLSISAELSEEKSDDKENYTRKEFSYSSFNRSFTLPDDIKEESVHAKYEDGLLSLTIEKAAEQRQAKKSISVE